MNTFPAMTRPELSIFSAMPSVPMFPKRPPFPSLPPSTLLPVSASLHCFQRPLLSPLLCPLSSQHLLCLLSFPLPASLFQSLSLPLRACFLTAQHCSQPYPYTLPLPPSLTTEGQVISLSINFSTSSSFRVVTKVCKATSGWNINESGASKQSYTCRNPKMRVNKKKKKKQSSDCLCRRDCFVFLPAIRCFSHSRVTLQCSFNTVHALLSLGKFIVFLTC